MSQQQYSPEFKDEAVRQVTERGRSVQEVAARQSAEDDGP
jgi:transposase-like protein